MSDDENIIVYLFLPSFFLYPLAIYLNFYLNFYLSIYISVFLSIYPSGDEITLGHNPIESSLPVSPIFIRNGHQNETSNDLLGEYLLLWFVISIFKSDLMSLKAEHLLKAYKVQSRVKSQPFLFNISEIKNSLLLHFASNITIILLL